MGHQTGARLKDAVNEITIFEKKSGKAVTVFPADAREMLNQTDNFYTSTNPKTKKDGGAKELLAGQKTSSPEHTPVVDSPAPSEEPKGKK